MTMRPFPILLALTLTACAGGERPAPLSGVAADVTPAMLTQLSTSELSRDYRIGASDLLTITVFQVPDLSFEEIRVDASGNVQLPLLGTLRADGMTPQDLAANIRGRLAESYVRDPQVAVTVKESAGQKVTVDGAVTKPGVYKMQGQTTLLQAVAMAEGAIRSADQRSVAVFRTVEGRRMVAVFNLQDIRNGQADDPVLRGDDLVVVDTDRLNANMRDLLTALPGLAVFAYF